MRKFITFIVSILIVCLVCYAAYRGYKSWRQERLVAMAREFYAKSDTKNALLSLREALNANPRNIQAARLAAVMLEAGRSPESLLWRSVVVELDPKSTDDRIALAKTAMLFMDYGVATNALAGVSEAGKKTVAYQNIAGTVMAAVNLFPEAKEHFLEAARLDPHNPASQLNLALVDFHGTNETAIASARATLGRLSQDATNADLRCRTFRELVMDAMRNERDNSALALSKELLLQTNATFADNLLRLEVLRGTTNAEFKATMLADERDASIDAGKLFEMATWQQIHGQAKEGLAWLQSLGGNIRTNLPGALLITEFHVNLRDWSGLQRSLEHENWAESDFLRHAFLALGLRNQELIDSSKGEWEQALRAAGNQKMSRIMLLRLCAQWGWRNETEELLWIVVNHYPDEIWASRALAQLLFVGGRTHSLLELFAEENKMHPADLVNKNNLAIIALLLDSKDVKPYNLAREAYEGSPTNSFFATTYAISLLWQKKNSEALNIMKALKPADLENPSTAGYYAMVLNANGEQSEAKKYLGFAAKSLHLPEEQRLFDLAGARN
jgi:predicted Zn-dependent protease